MSQPAKAQEPSMEEILASIRRIIADDDNAKPAPAPMPPPVAAAPPPPPPPQAVEPAPEPEPETTQNEVDAMIAALGTQQVEEPPQAQSEDVLDLTESMAALPPEQEPGFQTIDGQSDIMFSDPPAGAQARPFEEQPRSPRQNNSQERSLLSDATTTAVNSAFNTLAQTVLVHNARTLEDLVREMLRPLLKAWLDDNLPSMVERIVRAEIERVSRGRN